VTISVSGPVTVTWWLVASPAGWRFCHEPGPRTVASLAMTTEQAWRMLTNNLPASERSRITAPAPAPAPGTGTGTGPGSGSGSGSGDAEILDILYQTRAIIGTPK